MSAAADELLIAFEVHSVERIRAVLDAGLDPRSPVRGKTPVNLLIEMYWRSDAFPVIEHESVPTDAPVVGSTWQYVNKSGGPDRRFNNNRQLPILQYGELHLTSSTGLNEVIQVSNPKAPEYFALGIRGLAASLTAEATPNSL